MLAGTSTAGFGVNDQNPLRIGGGATEGDGNFFFPGGIDEVAIYSTPLTAEQVVSHYLAGTPPSLAPSPLQAARNGAEVILTWTLGALQSAPTVTGPWSPVTPSASPYTVTPENPAAFYRLK